MEVLYTNPHLAPALARTHTDVEVEVETPAHTSPLASLSTATWQELFEAACRSDDAGHVGSAIRLFEEAAEAMEAAEASPIIPAHADADADADTERLSEALDTEAKPTDALRTYLDLRLVHLYHDGSGQPELAERAARRAVAREGATSQGPSSMTLSALAMALEAHNTHSSASTPSEGQKTTCTQNTHTHTHTCTHTRIQTHAHTHTHTHTRSPTPSCGG